MKRVLLLVALCVATSASFAQKKAVNQALAITKGEKNYGEARNLIKGTLDNPETKNDAKTWYVAGFIEDQVFESERAKMLLGQQPNEAVMYQSLLEILPYFRKTMELDQLPDAKGKVKPKFTKDIKGILATNHMYYINSGAFYFDEKDYPKAYDSFEQYLEISNLPMFEGEAVAERDSNFMTVQFYAAVAATQLDKPELAIAALERAKHDDFKPNDVYQYLAYEYQQVQDTVNWEKTLQEGMEKFPDDEYFVSNLIYSYINANKNELAIANLEKAIASKPNDPQLYDVLGRVYESGLNDMENAEKYFSKALELDPNYADALSNLGRVYYNQGVNKLGDANQINDNKLYQEELAKAKELFEKALPYFVKARELKPDEKEIKIALRGIYYNLNMGKEYEEIEAELNK